MREQTNLTNEQLRKLLGDIKTIAVVGLSNKPERPAYGVSSYLVRSGYTVIPVNPRAESVFGLQAYKTISEIPVKIDLIDKEDVAGAIILPPRKVAECGRWLLNTLGQDRLGLPKELADILHRLSRQKGLHRVLKRGDKQRIREALRVLKS